MSITVWKHEMEEFGTCRYMNETCKNGEEVSVLEVYSVPDGEWVDEPVFRSVMQPFGRCPWRPRQNKAREES